MAADDNLIICFCTAVYLLFCRFYCNISPQESRVIFVQLDYDYLCQNLGHLSGLQTRIYQQGELIHRYVNVDYQPDLVSLVMSRIEDSPHNICFFDAADSLFFGALKKQDENLIIVIGPTYRSGLGRDRLTAILRVLGESQERQSELATYLHSVPAYPLENFLQILCFINYALNNEKLTIAGLLARDAGLAIPAGLPSKAQAPPGGGEAVLHNTYQMERLVFSYVRAGQTDVLREFTRQPPTGRPGKIAHDDLRQQKNTFICAATLASRAAIDGGLPPETAFTLSDLYIQKVEILNSTNEVTRLNVEMLFDFTARVEELKCHGVKTRLTTEVVRYINSHLDKKVTTADIAAATGINRTHLCERFRQETGVTLNAFITEIKIEEAKRLLRETDKPLAQISDFLGFSSQSYFQNVFRQTVGATPNVYRQTLI